MAREARKPRLLLLLQLPPPVHGASVINQQVVDSKRLRESFDVAHVDINVNRNISTIRQFSLDKCWIAICAIFQLLSQLIINRPDVAYLTIAPGGWAFWRDAFFVAVLKLFRCRLALHFHGKGVTQQIENRPLQRRVFRWVCKGATLLSLCKAMNEDLLAIADLSQIRIVNNGIPDQFVAPEPDHDGKLLAKREELPVSILYLANMIPEKGPLFLVKALEQLKARDIPFHAHFIGGWRHDLSPENFDDAVRQSDITDYVTVHGPVYGDAKFDHLRSTAIYVLPTRYKFETFPVSILEAMSSGAAVIATPEGGITEIIQDKTNGLIVPGTDERLWADALQNLIEDPDLRRRLGKAARANFEQHYTLDAFETRLRDVLLDAVAVGNGRSVAKLVGLPQSGR